LRVKVIIPIIAGILIVGTIAAYSFLSADTDLRQQFTEYVADENVDLLDFDGYSELFKTYVDKKDILNVSEEGILEVETLFFELRPNLQETYNKIGLFKEPQNTVVIVPLFTASAYLEHGFYDYFSNECDQSCLTVNIVEESKLAKTSSEIGVKILRLLGYQTITDIDLAQDPTILANYDKVILLHSEYVTAEMFEAITNHPKVIYLYPNALYAQVKTDYKQNTITLVRGHSYPQTNILNGFDWEFDNTHPYEFDTECANWEFYEIPNGVMLNCYPETSIFAHNEKFLQAIKEF